MAILTPDYERLQNGQTTDFDMTQEYREDFENRNISAAQALITSDNDHLVMKADKLNDLCETIWHMETYWANDKGDFTLKYFRLTQRPSVYRSSATYNIGDMVTYNGKPYICISDNTTGTWVDNHWLRMGGDDIGLYFEDASTALHDGELGCSYDATNKRVVWQYGSARTTAGYTYSNIRYLQNGDTPYDGEIYMTDYEGGGA